MLRLDESPEVTADEELAVRLAEMPPGPELAAVLRELDVEAAGEYSLVEVVAAYRRQQAWAAAGAAQAAAVLADRPAMNPTWPPRAGRDGEPECVAAEELALRLAVTRGEARRLVDAGRAFARELDETGQALASGVIDERKATTIVTTLQPYPEAIAFAVQAEVLPRAGIRTHTQLVADLARALVAVDPEEADRRHARARTQRRFNHPRPLPDGMASIYAVLPAVDAIALDLAAEAAARCAKDAGDPRTLDQLRADALATLGHTALDTGWIGPPPGGAAGGEKHPSAAGTRMRLSHIGGRRTHVRVTVPLAVALPPATWSGSPADLVGLTGAIPGAPPPDWPPGTGTSLEPDGGELPEDPLAGVESPRDADPPWELDLLDPPPVDLGDLPPDPFAGITEAELIPCLDLPSEPVAELDGYGPITPAVARALALGGTWQRLVTDPGSGAVLDVGRTRYQPPADLAAYVRERDRTCTRPGCTTPARSCDLDHTLPWSQSGATAADNLGALCPRDHTIKTLGAYRVRHLGGGAYEWATPTGHVYRRETDGSITCLGRERQQPAPANGGSAWRFDADASDGPPPF